MKKKDLIKSTPVSTDGTLMDRYENDRRPMHFIIDYSRQSYFASGFNTKDQYLISKKLKKYNVEIEFTGEKEYKLTGTCSQSEIASAFIYIGYFMGRKDERVNP